MSTTGESAGSSATEIATLISALGKHGSLEAGHAREQLVTIGEPAVQALIEALDDEDTQVRWEAAKALSEIGSAKSAEALVASLRDQDGGVRWLAGDGLIAVGEPALPAVLRGLIEHAESPVVREGVHHVLSGFTHNRKYGPQVAGILASLDGQAPEVACLAPSEALLKQIAG